MRRIQTIQKLRSGGVAAPVVLALLLLSGAAPATRANIFEDVGNAVSDAATDVKNGIEAVGESIADMAKSGYDHVKNFTTDVEDKITSGITETFKNVKSEARDFESSLKGWLSAADSLYTAADNVEEGDVEPLTAEQAQYTPRSKKCGDFDMEIVSQKDALKQELDWVSKREGSAVFADAWRKYLENLDLEGLDVDKAAKDGPPRIAIAASGGGYRAMLNDGGVLSALDARTDGSVKTRGMLQFTSYLMGLSGGSWLTSSLWYHDGMAVNKWADNLDLEPGLLNPGKTETEQTSNYQVFIQQAINKTGAGYQSTILDLWGRDVCYYMMHENDYCVNFTFSSGLRSKSAFKDHSFPFPVEVASFIPAEDGDSFAKVGLAWEFSPYSAGVGTKALDGYLPTDLLGTTYNNGKVADKDNCATNFDNIGWVTGASSAIFAVMQDVANATDELWEIADIAVGLAANPYKGMEVAGRKSNSNLAIFGDGGLGPWGNLPLYPATAPERKIDIVLAIDSSNNNDDHLPSGKALVQAAQYAQFNNRSFPPVPSQDYFDSHPELLANVTFFGCPSTDGGTSSSPLVVVYAPNHEVSYPSGQSTYKMQYTKDEVAGMMDNGYDQLAEGDTTQCLGCLLLSLTPGGAPSACKDCMEQRCWKGEGADLASESTMTSSDSGI